MVTDKLRIMSKASVSTDSLAMNEQVQYTGPKLRCAIIGCGGIAQTHLDAFKAAAPEVEIVAGVDPKPERLTIMREKWGVTELFSEHTEMLKKLKPDIVLVATPNGAHAQPSIDAANAGCHVMVEKPMAMTPAECQAMIDAAEKNNVKLAVGFQYRYHPNTQFLVRAREEGEFGDMMFVRCQALRRRGIPNWGVFGQKHLQGGGPLIDIGVHVVEMAHFMLGSPKPVAASGNTWTYLGDKASKTVSQWPGWDYKTYTVEDLAIGQIRFDNGAILQIEASFVAHIKEDLWNFTMMGQKGGATWSPPELYSDRSGYMLNSTPGFVPSESGFPVLFQIKQRNWLDAILKGTPLLAPGQAGLDVQKMLDGVYRSAAAGKEVEI